MTTDGFARRCYIRPAHIIFFRIEYLQVIACRRGLASSPPEGPYGRLPPVEARPFSGAGYPASGKFLLTRRRHHPVVHGALRAWPGAYAWPRLVREARPPAYPRHWSERRLLRSLRQNLISSAIRRIPGAILLHRFPIARWRRRV